MRIMSVWWIVGLVKKSNQFHAVSRTQEDRQREPSVKILRSSHQNLEALCVEWRSSTPRFVSTPERRNGTINLSKYFISSSGDRTHNQSVLQSHLVPLRHDRPLLPTNIEIIYFVKGIQLVDLKIKISLTKLTIFFSVSYKVY